MLYSTEILYIMYKCTCILVYKNMKFTIRNDKTNIKNKSHHIHITAIIQLTINQECYFIKFEILYPYMYKMRIQIQNIFI